VGFHFLGFVLSVRSRRMRPKAVKKPQDKVRSLTIRHQNLDAAVLEKRNRLTDNDRPPNAKLAQLGLLSLERSCWR